VVWRIGGFRCGGFYIGVIWEVGRVGSGEFGISELARVIHYLYRRSLFRSFDRILNNFIVLFLNYSKKKLRLDDYSGDFNSYVKST